ncbi:MAG: group III truncated hemoglobin [Bdellovibrionaceae bacterium]|nr:group III truncated hemoglobin [Pseudobdellovibrionaceae bacterium]
MPPQKPEPQTSILVYGVAFTHLEIFQVIDDFYTRIQQDPILSVPFQSVHDWPHHIERLTHFWWIRFGGKPYLFSDYNPVLKHFFAGFNDMLLQRWLGLFHATIDEHLDPEQAELWKNVSSRMGQALSMKNEMYKQQHNAQKKEQE